MQLLGAEDRLQGSSTNWVCSELKRGVGRRVAHDFTLDALEQSTETVVF
jgi:hypothetical protein